MKSKKQRKTVPSSVPANAVMRTAEEVQAARKLCAEILAAAKSVLEGVTNAEAQAGLAFALGHVSYGHDSSQHHPGCGCVERAMKLTSIGYDYQALLVSQKEKRAGTH